MSQRTSPPLFSPSVGNRQRRARPWNLSLLLVVGALTLGAVIFMLPFLWMVLTSLKSDRQVRTIPLLLWPDPLLIEPYVRAWVGANFSQYTLNSLIVSTAAAAVNAFLSALMGYTLARLRFRGREVVFTLILSTLMVPVQIAFIPMFLIVARMPLLGGNDLLGQGGSGLLDTYAGLLAPHVITAFGIFLLRQFMLGFPTDLEDAARVDGASEFMIFWRIMLPLSVPALITLFLLHFTGVWNDLLWPLVVTNSEAMRTLPLGLSQLRGTLYTEWNMVMAGTAISVIPTIIIFIIGQRYFQRSIAITGLK
ncbi:MAG: carbohydrate ABC transporter permease [Caldilinea sp.]|jgi:multiple sugar transport system permease protein|nr:carbohydrate ABC transporter permease [Caldilinea sp.]